MLGRLIHVAGEEIKYNLIYLRQQMAGANYERAKVLVNGSPKSGTTWMLKMIASLPGYEIVGNFDGDTQRYHSVEPGHVVHGHDWYTPELNDILARNGIKVILMVRDPRDQLVSRMFHVKRSPKHRWHERIQNMSLDEALMVCIEGREGLPGTRTMINLAQSWLHQETAVLCVKYEELLADSVGYFSQALRYIGVTKNVNALSEVIVARNRFERLSMGRRIWQNGRKPGEENAQSHFRKGITGDWKNYMKPAHIEKFKEVAGQQLIELGYEKDFNWTL